MAKLQIIAGKSFFTGAQILGVAFASGAPNSSEVVIWAENVAKGRPAAILCLNGYRAEVSAYEDLRGKWERWASDYGISVSFVDEIRRTSESF